MPNKTLDIWPPQGPMGISHPVLWGWSFSEYREDRHSPSWDALCCFCFLLSFQWKITGTSGFSQFGGHWPVLCLEVWAQSWFHHKHWAISHTGVIHLIWGRSVSIFLFGDKWWLTWNEVCSSTESQLAPQRVHWHWCKMQMCSFLSLDFCLLTCGLPYRLKPVPSAIWKAH